MSSWGLYVVFRNASDREANKPFCYVGPIDLNNLDEINQFKQGLLDHGWKEDNCELRTLLDPRGIRAFAQDEFVRVVK